MLEATLLISQDGKVETFHSHSSADSFEEILIDLEDQFINLEESNE
jgi:hypothetical protein